MRGTAIVSKSCHLVLILIAMFSAGCAEFFGPVSEPEPLKATVRMRAIQIPAQLSDHTWLICAGFPSPAGSGTAEALAEDFLAMAGGEAEIRPDEGMTITNGTEEVRWFRHEAEGSVIDLKGLMMERNASNLVESVVAYAYTTIESKESCDSLLGIGSDDGVRVWLNGHLVHDNPIRRGCTENQDLVPVRLRYGTNHLLLKVEQGNGGWEFSLNAFDRHNLQAKATADMHRLQIRLTLVGPASAAPSRADVFTGQTRVGQAAFTIDPNGLTATATTEIPLPPRGEYHDDGHVWLNGRRAASFAFPQVDRRRVETFVQQAPVAQPAVFSGLDFPPIAFKRPQWISELVGPYSLKTTFYDSDYNRVTSAEQPGRYGAVVEIRTADGPTFRRFVTLYRLKTAVNWAKQDFEADIAFPGELDISNRVLNGYRDSVSEFASACIQQAFTANGMGAVLLAGLNEAQSDSAEAGYYNEAQRRDRRWWLGLKRRLYGWEERYDRMVARPQPLETPARVVREGFIGEAGMKPDFPEKLDALLTEWADDSDEAFTACVLRHGVIAFHRAYGMRDGSPARVDTKSWMASITKLLSGTLIMMLVDQGLMALDDPIADYLPPTRTGASPALTIRHLYTHTDDLDGHYGSELPDLEERIACLLPACRPGSEYRYNGTGMELACKALEAVSGKTLADFFVEHLLKPLDCSNTDVDSASWSAYSVPLDMARVGQMLLQKGAYGNWRFFSENTFEQMLPRNLEYILGKPTNVEYGIGTSFFHGEGLSDATFAHGAASAATLRIDPVNDLVIVMTRNRAGKNFNKYHQRFIDTIVEGMAKE